MISTTSSFSPAGVKTAEKNNVELWDWKILKNKIKETYLDGQTVYEYFKDEI